MSYPDAATISGASILLRTLPSFSFLLLGLFLCELWLTGGASRGDVMGQVFVRAGAWSTLIVAFLFAARPSFADQRPVALLMLGMVLMPLIQLIPLPAGIWQALPGREIISQAAIFDPAPTPWRPISMSPSGTRNALSSLVVPVVILVLLAGLRQTERAWLPMVLLALVVASTLVGLVQFSGSRFEQPLINYTGDVSGTFANRNHFALFLAVGCLGAPMWMVSGERRQMQWRAPIAMGLLLLFLLTVIASGSRSGLVLSIIALPIGSLVVREDLARRLRGRRTLMFPALIAGTAGVIAAVVVVAVKLDRAVSVERLLTTDVAQDMRVRGSSTVWAMVGQYFPVGTGLGSFKSMFRIHEPFALLKLTYFNHAHNDFAEVLLNAGVAGLLLLVAALLWWMSASRCVWRGPAVAPVLSGRLGSAIIGLVLFASIVDYPARTPLIMAVVAMAASLLAWGASSARSSLPHAEPRRDRSDRR